MTSSRSCRGRWGGARDAEAGTGRDARSEGTASRCCRPRGSAHLAPGSLRTEVKWPRDGGSVVAASGQTVGLTRGRGAREPRVRLLRSVGPFRGPAAAPQPPGDPEVLASAAAGGVPHLPLQMEAAPAPAQSHRPTPRCPLAAQAARPRRRRRPPRSSSAPQPRRSPLFAGLAATKWR
ncbi:unnamed protein product [Rangifer tarandus platyrhynchus]|uniref:Uncharacterized protein n=2 Tax=Rangifer tarandus platyrhynchus TaxID=3082113 RepID=A0ABN8ZJR0_RANTA|nr:unnamed protein product [Rangifer tarandus platyrhynchus]CAI9708243.1 unnamed protein product [Rangifer tarandus platyrhynchus]